MSLLPGKRRPVNLIGRYTAGDGRQGGGRSLPPITLGPAGKCPRRGERPRMTVFDFDNSGSVVGGADSIGYRFEEADYAVRYLGRHCTCGRCQVAILHFDTPSSCDVPPTVLNRRGRTAIADGLQIPIEQPYGTSALWQSLEAAHIIANESTEYDVTLAVLSDFELFDHDVPAVLGRFGDFPGRAHAVVLRSAPPQALIDDHRVTVTHVTGGAEIGAVARALFAALTEGRRTQPASKGVLT